MNAVRVWRIFAILTLLVLPGCGLRTAPVLLDVEQPLELDNTPFFAQEKYQCGPASLAMLLGASGVDTDPEALAPKTYLPGREGSLQLELLAAARQYDRVPYVIAPDISALMAELQAGRPVLVLQNLGLTRLPAYHYAVVIGVQPSNKVVLRSGTTRRLVADAGDFVATWRRAGSWGMIALRPGELPAQPDPLEYLRAVSAFEAAGMGISANPAYQAALAAWPDDQNAMFALANNFLHQARYREAEMWYRRILQVNPEHLAAANNLAESLARRGKRREALAVITEAAAVAEKIDSPFRDAIMRTLDELSRGDH